MTNNRDVTNNDYAGFLRLFFKILLACALFGLLIVYPYGAFWIYSSGDNAAGRAARAQAAGEYVVFGSGISQDFVDYKLRLYEAVKPEIAAVGSSRVMQFHGDWFEEPFVNMGGVAGNLAVLRSTIGAMLAMHMPKAILIGVDFWWFMPQWEKNPRAVIAPTSGSYNYGPENVKKPWLWLLQGKIGLHDFFRPLLGAFGQGVKSGRYGIMAQQFDEGFGPDGAWNYTGELTGLKVPFDYRFRDTLSQVAYGMKAFYHAPGGRISREHLEVFAEIVRLAEKRGVETFVFIPPLAPEIFEAMRIRENLYPHLFGLKKALAGYGIEAMDFSDPNEIASSHCEFVDGFHGGAVTYARLLRRMALHWPRLAPYIDMARLDKIVENWSGHAMIGDGRLSARPEIDFMNFGCVKKSMN